MRPHWGLPLKQLKSLTAIPHHFRLQIWILDLCRSNLCMVHKICEFIQNSLISEQGCIVSLIFCEQFFEISNPFLPLFRLQLGFCWISILWVVLHCVMNAELITSIFDPMNHFLHCGVGFSTAMAGYSLVIMSPVRNRLVYLFCWSLAGSDTVPIKPFVLQLFLTFKFFT